MARTIGARVQPPGVESLAFVSAARKQFVAVLFLTAAREFARVLSALKIRLPNQYKVRDGAPLDPQDTTETSVDLKVQNQKGVDLNFTSLDMTLSLDDFSERILEPAMSVLAATIEADAMSMYADVYNQVDNLGGDASFAKVLLGRKMLVDNLAPLNGRTCNLNTQDNVDLVDALSGLFNDKATISKQNREGYMGRTAGFDFMENTLWPRHTSGTENGSSTTLAVSGASQTGSAITIANGSSKTLTQGDIVTIAGVNRVHPETKADTGVLQQFVVTTALGTSGTTLNISPAIVTSGAGQTVTASPANSAVIKKVGGASQVYGLSMAYQKGAFAFATADMVMPRGVDFAAREVFDGISMRIVRQYDINNDKFPCRLDVLYGYQTVRPQLACRLANH